MKPFKIFYKTVSLLFFMFLYFTSFAQQYEWIKVLGSTEFLEVKTIRTSGEDVYVYGDFYGTATIGTYTIKSPGVVSSGSPRALFIAKYDTLGNVKWVKHFFGLNNNSQLTVSAEDLTVDDNGDIYISGFCNGDLDFDGTSIQPVRLGNGYTTNTFNFIAKLNSSGIAQWAKPFNQNRTITSYYGAGYTPTRVAVTTSGLYVSAGASLITGDTIYYDNNPTTTVVKMNAFLLYINKSNGNLNWSKRIGTYLQPPVSSQGNYSSITAIKATSSNDLIIAGYYALNLAVDTFMIDEGDANSPTMAITDGAMFLLKVNSYGIAQWLKSSEKADNIPNRRNQGVVPKDIALDDADNIYLTGFFKGHFKYENEYLGNSSIYNSSLLFLLKTDQQGSVLNSKYYHSDTINYVPTNNPPLVSYDSIVGNSIAVDRDKNIYVVGNFNKTVDFGVQEHKSYGDNDIFVLKLNSSFQEEWVSPAGGGSRDNGNTIDIDDWGKVYVGGRFKGVSVFGTRNITSIGNYHNGVFYKLGECDGFKAPLTVFGDSVICGSSGIVALHTTNGQGYSYQWLKDGNILPGENFPTYITTTSGDYQVIVNDNGCIDTSRVVATKIGVTPPSVSLNVVDTVCVLDTAFTLSGGMPLGGFYRGNGVVNNNTFDPSIAGVGNARIAYVADSLGCEDSAIAYIYVKAAPAPLISGNQQPCAFSTAQSYSTTYNAGNTYLWVVSGGTIASGQGTNSIIVDWGSAGKGIIKLTETDASCSSTIIDTIDIVSATIKADIAGKDSICLDNSIYTYSVATPSLFYNWSVNGGTLISGQGNSSVQIRWNTVGEHQISVRLFNNCNKDSIFYDTISVFPKPTPLFTGPTSVCANSNSVYTTTSASSTFHWILSGGGTIVSGQNTNTIEIDWGATATTANLKLIETTINGCVDSTTQQISVLPTFNTLLQVDICQGSSYTFAGQNLTTTGEYRDTLTAVNGCDSIVVLDLEVLPNVLDSIFIDICQGDSYTFGGQSISIAGVYTDTLIAANTCDSVVVLTLDVLPLSYYSFNADICQGSFYTFGSTNLTSAGIYYDTLSAVNGCDSIVTLTLNVLPNAQDSIFIDICQGDSYVFGGHNLITAGIYTDTLIATNGCDSVVVLTLDVLPLSYYSFTEDICQGGSFFFGGQNLSLAGVYYDTLLAVNGCDSIVTLTLNVYPNVVDSISVDICDGATYFFAGQNIALAGVYHDTLLTSYACDSVVVLSLNVLPNARDSVFANICQGSSYTFGGVNLTSAGIYHDTLNAVNGCDSVVVLTLDVLPTSIDSISATICSNQTYNFNGRTLSSSGIYSDTLLAINGCDSIEVLTLTVLSIAQHSFTRDICQGDSYLFGGINLSTAGVYVDTLTATNSCDSIVTLTLNVHPNITDSVYTAICDGDSISFAGQFIGVSGVYHDTLSTTFGCDSIVVLTLNVKPTMHDSIFVDICQGDTYSFGGQNLGLAGVYVDTLVASNSCDSIVTLTLGVLPSPAYSYTETICEGDTILFAGQALSNSGVYTDTLVATNGCDSIVTLTLNVDIINNSVSVVRDTLFSQQMGASYQWLECDTATNTYVPIIGETNYYFVPVDSNYYAVAIAINSCTDTSTCVQADFAVGISSIGISQSKLEVYPNPTSNYINLVGNIDATSITIEIRSINGQLIKSLLMSVEDGYLDKRIDLSTLSQGIYLLHVSSDKQQFNQKIILK